MNFTGDTSGLSGASALPLLTSFKAFFFPFFSHLADPQPSTKKEEKVKKITLTVREYHTVEAAETDYQRRDYAVNVS